MTIHLYAGGSSLQITFLTQKRSGPLTNTPMPTQFSALDLLHLLGIHENADFDELGRYFRTTPACFSIEGLDSFRKGHLSKRIAWWVDGAPVVVYVYDFGIWESGEIPEMLYRLRSSQGFPHTVEECRGELVEENQEGYLTCLVACCLFNNWDFFVGTTDQRVKVFATHDDEIYINSIDPAARDSFDKEMTEWGLRKFDNLLCKPDSVPID